MYGVSKISSEQNIMLTTFPGAQYLSLIHISEPTRP